MPKIFRELRLRNFQRHKDLRLELSPKLTAIIGAGDRGKSSLVRSVGHLLVGDPNSDALRHHWYEDGEKIVSKQTSVAADIEDDGVTTTVERIRSKSINRYVITKDGEEPLVLNRFGRGVPQDVLDVTGMEPLTIGDQTIFPYIQRQHDPYFLLSGMSGPSRWKSISALAGTEDADVATRGLNSDIAGLGKDINALDEQITEDKEALEAESLVLSSLTSLFEKVDVLTKDVRVATERSYTIEDLSQRLTEVSEKLGFVSADTLAWTLMSQSLSKALEGLEATQTRWSSLKSLVDNLRTVDEGLEVLGPQLTSATALASVKTPDPGKLFKLAKLVVAERTSGTELETLGLQLKSAEALTGISVPDTQKATALTTLITGGQELNEARKANRGATAKAQAVLDVDLPDIDRYHHLKAAVTAAKSWTKDNQVCSSSLTQAEEKVSGLQEEFEKALVEAGQCPLCGQSQTRTSCSCS